MENVEVKPQIDVDTMCRMCHHHLDADKSVEIFDDETATSLPISVQIKIFAGIDVSSMEAMPKKLCLACRLHLEKSNLMRTKCKNLEAKMRKHLRIIKAGRVSHVFDDGDMDENEDEYLESVKIIEALSQQLDEDQNGNCKQQIDFELEKKRIFDEAQAIFEEQLNAVKAKAQQNLEETEKKLLSCVAEAQRNQDEMKKDFKKLLSAAEDELEIHRREAKFERENIVAEMNEDHAAEIKRIKDEAEEKLRTLLNTQQANEPPFKRKHSAISSASEMKTVVLNGDLVSIAVPVADQTTYTILKTDELEFVEFIPYPEEKPKDRKVHPCGACEKEFSDEILGKFCRQRNGINYNFCSNSCAVWFDVINDADVLLKDDFTESEYNAWLKENGPVEPYVLPSDPVEPVASKPPKVKPVRQPIQRPKPNANVVVKQEIDDLSEYVSGNGKFCYTCKKNIVTGGVTAKSNNIVANFCNSKCLSRAASVRPLGTVAIKREMMQYGPVAVNPMDSALKFYCEVCGHSYMYKRSLKRHFKSAHPCQSFNENIVARI